MSRMSDISTYLFERGETSVTDLARILGASLATVRRDLNVLEHQGLIERSHGAARLAARAKTEVGHKSREEQNLVAKRSIAMTAYALLRPGNTILLDAGTTVLQLARQIKLAPLPLTIVTNGLAVAQELADVPIVNLCLLGGRLRTGHLSVVGPLAETMLLNLWLDFAFLGTSALSDDLWLTSYDADEAQLNALMASRAERLVLLADQSKMSRQATYGVRHLLCEDTLITDKAPPDGLVASAVQTGIKILVAKEQDHA